MNSKRIFLLLPLLLMFSLSCSLGGLFGAEEGTAPGAPAPTEEFTAEEITEAEAEAEPTEVRRRPVPPTPTPFHLVSEEDVRQTLNLNSPDLLDYFQEDDTWFDWDDEDKAGYAFVDEHLEGVDHEPDVYYNWWSYSTHYGGNTYAEITATNGDCVNKDAVGFTIRVNSEKGAGGYGLEVSCDGNWRFIKHKVGETRVVMLDWEPSDLINAGAFESNRLGIWGYQNNFHLFINGVEVGQLVDEQYKFKHGNYAVYVHALYTYDLTATFDDFAAWEIVEPE